MKLIQFVQVFALLSVVLCDSSHAKRGIIFRNWPVRPGVHSSSKQVARGHAANSKQQKTLVVQIRSDQPVPLVLKGRPSHGAQHVHPGAAHIHRGRPIKLTAPVYLKTVPGHASQMLRKPLKIKLTNSKLQHKPAATYEKPFKYEQPAISYSQVQKLPFETYTNFHNDHFTPIHTIPAPNLALQDNHLSEGNYLPPKPQPYHQSNKPNYQVLEETNDETIVDASSGSQKLFAPDPDPSLPAIPIRPATESFNQPSIGKPLPVDVQTNYLLPAQPLVQIVGAQQISHSIPEIYPVEPQLQSLVSVPTASLPLYNPTYLVSQSNNLYNQHQQQLFQPAAHIIESNYANADLTQEVASNGQILQAVKDHNAHPVFDGAPQFAALIAAPSLSNQQQNLGAAPFHLPNVAAVSPAPEIFSPYYEQAQDSSQLLQAYAEDEALIAQQQQQQHQQEQLLQQQQHEQLLQQQQQQEEEHQLLQQQQNHLLELQRQQQLEQTHIPLQQDPSSSAFEEHQRLVQQQLGNVPLRIFVPDDDSSDGPRLQKRADNLNKGTVEDAKSGRTGDLFEVSSSVEVSNNNDKDELALIKTNRN